VREQTTVLLEPVVSHGGHYADGDGTAIEETVGVNIVVDGDADLDIYRCGLYRI
jgi:hypothetical protein